jgi:hypothetical protein
MNWRLIAFEMGLFWNDPLRSKNARRANVQARMSYGRMHFVRMLRECLRRFYLRSSNYQFGDQCCGGLEREIMKN